MAEEEVYHAVGKRKTAIARIWMKPGKGNIRINNKSFEEYLSREADKEIIKQPLEITNTSDKYDISVNVRGGGVLGQSGAIRHAISRALVNINSEFRLLLKKANMLTRDPRMKERKKYGRSGARARFQYSKR
jgi:small subunit ribosomal protein S9